MRPFIWLCSLGFCVSSFAQPTLKWSASLHLQGKTIDFILEQKMTRIYPPQYQIWNGKERIDLISNSLQGDSIVCPISIFDAELKFPISPKESFSGFYKKNDSKIANYRVPFSAKPYSKTESQHVAAPMFNWNGQWLVEFMEDGQVSDSGLAVLTTKGDSVYGSILSETGDYRYLNGRATGKTMYLQTFDGAHTYRFDFEEDGSGTFIYSLNGKQNIRWKKLDANPLTNGFTKSRAKEKQKFSFKAKDEKGNSVDQNLGQLKGKALVVQVLGSWCPNCLDEARFLTEAYPQKPTNVEFVGLAFERKNDPAYAYSRIAIVKSRLKVPYPIYWAGLSNKDSASKALPALTAVLSFPTTVFVRADGSILAVHTGFSGPATGAYYTKWKEEFADLKKQLAKK